MYLQVRKLEQVHAFGCRLIWVQFPFLPQLTQHLRYLSLNLLSVQRDSLLCKLTEEKEVETYKTTAKNRGLPLWMARLLELWIGLYKRTFTNKKLDNNFANALRSNDYLRLLSKRKSKTPYVYILLTVGGSIAISKLFC